MDYLTKPMLIEAYQMADILGQIEKATSEESASQLRVSLRGFENSLLKQYSAHDINRIKVKAITLTGAVQ